MKTKRPPGPKGNPITGNISDFAAGQLDFLLETAKEYGDISFLKLLVFNAYLLAESDLVREVLVSQKDIFEKAAIDKKILGKFLGQGLLISEGDFHKRQRKLAQPAFHHRRIQNYAEVMVDYTDHLLNDWQDGQPVDMADEMMRLTMFIVSKTLFDADAITSSGDTAETVSQAIHDLQRISNADYQRGFLIPDWVPTANNRTRKQAIIQYQHTIDAIITERRATAVNGQVEDSGDLLSMLMLSQDEDGSQMDDKQLRDEVATLFAAGHETTSNALTWTWYLLSQHPKAEAKLHEEVDRVLNGRFPTLSDLEQLPYTLTVIKESMRLYPPAWILNGRVAIQDTQIGGYDVPKGTTIFISPYVMHRLPQHFPNPEQFNPDRWTAEMEKALPKYAYMPFGGGPRICIGNAFAMMEAQLILATIAQRFQMSLQPDYHLELNSHITLSPKGGMPMQLQARTSEELILAQQTVEAELIF